MPTSTPNSNSSSNTDSSASLTSSSAKQASHIDYEKLLLDLTQLYKTLAPGVFEAMEQSHALLALSANLTALLDADPASGIGGVSDIGDIGNIHNNHASVHDWAKR